MNTAQNTVVVRRSVRGIGFTIVTLLLGSLSVLAGGLLVGYAWTLEGTERASEIHYFHYAVEAVWIGGLIGLSLLALGITLTRSGLVMQFLVGFLIINAVGGLAFDPFFFVITAVITSLLILLYPGRRSLLDFRTGFSFKPPAAIIGWIVAVPLLINAYHNLDRQIRRIGGEHYQFDHWATTAVVEFGLVLAILLIATGLPGWRLLSLISGLSLLILGITSLIVPDHAGSWGVVGGLLAVFAGVGYLTFPIWQAARVTVESPEPSLETMPTS